MTPESLLILDIDNTLIYAADDEDPRPPVRDFMSCRRYPVMKRPYVHDFIDWCFAHPLWRIAIWSAAAEQHVSDVLSHLLTQRQRDALAFVYTSARCTRALVPPTEWDETRFVEVKDLKKVRRQGFPLDRILALDDSPRAYMRNYGNLVPIRPFQGEADDQQLLRVMPFLEQWFADPRGVRAIEKRFWNHASERL